MIFFLYFLAALERGVQVRLLLSDWPHSRQDMWRYLKSLTDLNGSQRGHVKIEGKKFKVNYDLIQEGIISSR